jgi:hypothetical protein
MKLEQINETMSFASFMDVQELRDLYYGRLNIYVSFTDDGQWEDSGKDYIGDVVRPKSVLAYSVDTVVGRKASTPDLYARVFRLNKDANFVKNIKNYSKDDLNNDIEILSLVGFYDQEEIDEISEEVLADTLIRSHFDKFWEITKRLAATKGKQLMAAYWRKTLLDLDYSGFEDQQGTGPFAEFRAQTVLIIDMKQAHMYDIVGVQKYQKDNRRNITSKIAREVKFLKGRRKRITRQDKELYWKKREGSNSKTKRVLDMINTYGFLL